MAQRERVARYHGRSYRLLWVGETKFGPRAHLAFWDGTKDFWVDGRLITEETGRTTYADRFDALGRPVPAGLDPEDALSFGYGGGGGSRFKRGRSDERLRRLP